MSPPLQLDLAPLQRNISPKRGYRPLALILGYLALAALSPEAALGGFDPMRVMRHFMAGFFLVFSFFKLLNLLAFARAFRMYDIPARIVPGYAVAYPFIELALGAAYLANWQPFAVNIATLALMLVGTVGVVRTLMTGQKVRCACLGAVIDLPMSTITLIEDVGMAAMATAMLF